MQLALLCLMKKRKGWSAQNLAGTTLQYLMTMSMSEAAAASVPSSFTSKKLLCTTLGRNSSILTDIKEKSALSRERHQLFPVAEAQGPCHSPLPAEILEGKLQLQCSSYGMAWSRLWISQKWVFFPPERPEFAFRIHTTAHINKHTEAFTCPFFSYKWVLMVTQDQRHLYLPGGCEILPLCCYTCGFHTERGDL